MNWTEVLVAALTGVGAGALGAVLAPWANWGIEKRKAKRKRRQTLIDSWYRMINRCQKDDDLDFTEQPEYLTLRHHLKPEVLKDIERSNHVYINAGGPRGIASDHDLSVLLSEIHRIEKEWGIL